MTHSHPSPSGAVTHAISSLAELRLALEYAAGGDAIVLAPGISIEEAQALAKQAGKRVTFSIGETHAA